MKTFNQDVHFRTFNWLELLRFICALSVLVWHYQHFFLNQHSVIFSSNRQPFYHYFEIFYNLGGNAVQLFWVISGYIFCWKYSIPIYKKIITMRQFIVNRFSRLYPLHFVTLLLVVILQHYYFKTHNQYFVYQDNNIENFILNIFFASSWLDRLNYSFNGPIWSVSVEILVYGLFFLFSYLVASNKFYILLMCILSVILLKTDIPVTRVISCSYYFFSGMMCYQIILFIYNKIFFRKFFIVIFLGTGLIGLLFLTHTKISFILIVLCFTIIEKIFPLQKVNFSVLGSMTYSSYLIHFPIQIGFVMISDFYGMSRGIYYYKSSFVIFILTTLILAYFIYKYFEQPVQNRIRQCLGNI